MGSIGALPEGTTAVAVTIRSRGRRLRSLVELFADDGGEFVMAVPVVGRGVLLELPLHVLEIERRTPKDLEVVVLVIREEEILGFQSVPVTVTIGFEEWSDVRWLAPVTDLLAHYALRSGSWTGEKVRIIKAAFGELMRSTTEAAALKDRLKLTNRPSPAEAITTLRSRLDPNELAGLILVPVAELLRVSGLREAAVKSELETLARQLKLRPEVFAEVFLQVFSGGAWSQKKHIPKNTSPGGVFEVF